MTYKLGKKTVAVKYQSLRIRNGTIIVGEFVYWVSPSLVLTFIIPVKLKFSPYRLRGGKNCSKYPKLLSNASFSASLRQTMALPMLVSSTSISSKWDGDEKELL